MRCMDALGSSARLPRRFRVWYPEIIPGQKCLLTSELMIPVPGAYKRIRLTVKLIGNSKWSLGLGS